MHLLVHWTVVLAPHPAPRLIGGLRISHHWCVEGVHCGLLLPFEWKASHTSCSFLFHFWLCILNMIWPSLPNLTNNRVSRNKPEILWSLQHLCWKPFFTDMVLGFWPGSGGGCHKEKLRGGWERYLEKNKQTFLEEDEGSSVRNQGTEGRGGHGPWEHHLLGAVSGWILVSRV